jgi:transcriptional regulator with XRE-family HTH domain
MTIAETKANLDLKTVGGRIQFHRISNGWSRAFLGAKMGLSASTISGYERNAEGYKPRPETIRRFSDALGCRPTSIDPEFEEIVKFRYVGNNTFTVYGGEDRTLGAYDLKKGAKLTTHEIGGILARLGAGGIHSKIVR